MKQGTEINAKREKNLKKRSEKMVEESLEICDLKFSFEPGHAFDECERSLLTVVCE